MPDTYEVDIELHAESNKKLIIPDMIRVPLHSIVRWNIKDLYNFFIATSYYRAALIFTVYFNKKSPFNWNRETFRTYGGPIYLPDFYEEKITIAEGIADKKGEYKYGVRLQRINEPEAIYDEDPFISVY